MSDYIGLKLGNYRIVRLIGRGGFANVYQGEHIYLKTPAAIKVLKMQLINDALERFLQEARIIALLEHPHIVRILEFGVEGITPFLVMNYANHGTLRQRYPQNSILPWSSIIPSLRQIADALQYAHDHGVIHRDVKPENMLLDKNRHIQLSDFGLAVIAQKQHMTVQTSNAGTTAYMAPEQLQGLPCRASDQYALGIVLYEWLCGSLPFTGSELEMTIHHLYTPPIPLHTKIPDISPTVERIMMKALAKDPQARFTTVQEFAQALEYAAISEKLFDGRVESPTLPGSSTGISSLTYGQAKNNFSEEIMLHPKQQQEPMNDSSPANFFPQIYERPPINNGRILQPSLGSSDPALEELSLPTMFSSQDGTLQSSHSSEVFLPPSILLSQQFLNLATPTFLPAIQEARGKQVSPLLQTPTTRHQHTPRHAVLTALVGMTIIGLIIVTGIMIWLQFTPTKLRTSLIQLTALTTPIATHTMHSTPTLHKVGSTSVTLPPTNNAPTTPPQPAALPGNTPGTTKTPAPVPAKTPAPTPFPTTASVPTPTRTVPLTVALVNPPTTATAGTTITIVTQANKGGVTIALNGKARFFGQLTANSQGIATFLVKVPLRANRMILTATAIDGNGNQVASGSQTVTVI